MKKYMELYREMRQDIVDGRYGFSERLPSKRLLAEERGISLITVEHALALLEEEGYIEGKERSGYFVSYQEGCVFPVKDEEEADEYRDFSKKKTSFSMEQMSYPTIAKAVRRAMSKYQEEILEASEMQGKHFLRKALKEYLRRGRGIFVEEEQMILGAGAENLYALLAQILGEEKLFAVESPSYDKMQRIYKSHGLDLEYLPMGKNGIESSALQRAKAKVLHVTPFHSYPTGITADASKRREYLDFARRNAGVIIEDDYDSEFSPLGKPEDCLFSMGGGENVFYMNSFSKTIGPAFRMAYLLLPKKNLKENLDKISFYSCSVPVLEQCILTELLESGEFERHINRVRRNRRIIKKTKEEAILLQKRI
jgi:bifunctional gntR family transcriptional regulator/aminotransferase (fragment)